MPTNRKRKARSASRPDNWESYCERMMNGWALYATPGTDEEVWQRYGAQFIHEHGHQGDFYERFGEPT